MRTLPIHDASPTTQPSYVPALVADLQERTTAEIRFDSGARAAWSTDASNYRHIPIGVVLPKTIADLIETVALCFKHGAPITSRGGGTSLAGQACNTAVIIDTSKYLTRILSLDPVARTASVEPGCILDDLRDAARPHGLTFGPDPATHNRNTLGGMIGNNSCGVHSVMSQFYGPGPLTRHQVISLDILTVDAEQFTVSATSDAEFEAIVAAGGRRGEIYRALRALRDKHASEIRQRFIDIPRRVSGYNLDALLPEHGFNIAHALVGTEGTCAFVLRATVQLIPDLPARSLLVLGYPDAFEAADHVPTIMAHKPVGLEGMDGVLIDLMRRRNWHPEQLAMLPRGNGWLLVEFGAETKLEADAQAERLMSALASAADAPSMLLASDPLDAANMWHIREAALGVTAHPTGMSPSYEGWEDAAVAPEKLGGYLRDLRALLNEFDYRSAMYGHFGQGCVHFRIDFDFTSAEGVAKFARFLDRAADLVVSHGGAISGEHGDGQARAIFLGKMYGDEIVTAFEEFKAIWDPRELMNPGKIVRPRRPDQDLRIKPASTRAALKTHFSYANEGGSFEAAAARCAGVGACRRTSTGTMCPSYMVTRNEEDSTRGRARMLFEMIQGDVLTDGWQNESVKDALDLCLACKGCKTECPVNVDIATYKSEFLSHYYEGHARPRLAYATGMIYRWARLGSPFARVINFFTQHAPTSTLFKWIAGVAPERSIPSFAPQSFRNWFNTRTANSSNKPRVILWPDTFNNFLHTSAAQAAVTVLEHAGFAVSIPARALCCGRPLYDWGMLDQAKELWRETLDALRDDIRAGTPIVGLEPSCVAAFRDELVRLFPDDADAMRLSQQTYLFGEFLVAQKYSPAPLTRRAIVHGHCHQKAVIGMGADLVLLTQMGVEFELLDSGCCGMAGSFGFEPHKYDISVKAAERVLLPATRTASADTLIITNGFSCQEQIKQLGGRTAVHLAEVMAMGLE